ncbi:MDIS1-interacting receptor like kinase 2-like [Papaver somniferum]|uniref:MDIS1-interacting receptor like kinase 2-like n=1 Tax=Papaver somniferum TaxID=3469 RepID=UPI000E6F848C|nr:MDIS1-interacting receptor like kinase 2-like [Papaver somniferum]
MGPIAKSLRNCTSLTLLGLSNNELVDNITEAFHIYPNLDRIGLKYNMFYGELSKNWGDCQKLTGMYPAGNNITGRIPPELGKLKILSELYAYSNHLVGEIPDELLKLSSLVRLYLYNNELSGGLSSAVGMLFNLQYLDLPENKLIGTIPKQLGEYSKLLSLNLSSNNFNGSIPIQIGSLDSLSILLDYSQNELSGEIPSDFGKLKKLEQLNLSHNKLFGSVPSSFDKMAFEDAPGDALKNNHGLCGNYSRGVLQPCKSSDVYNGKLVFEDLFEATENFDLKYCIGRGGYGSVYRAELSNGHVVAVKKLHSSDEDSELVDMKSFKSEVNALTEIRHRNIVKLFGFCCNPERRILFLEYEFIERGSLKSVLCDGERAAEFDWIKRISNNVLLDSEYEAHVSDFGTARILKPDSSNWTSLAGTYGYVAPELAYAMKCKGPDEKVHKEGNDNYKGMTHLAGVPDKYTFEDVKKAAMDVLGFLQQPCFDVYGLIDVPETAFKQRIKIVRN